MVVAVLALAAALIGTAVAAPVQISLNKKERKQIRKIANKVAKKRANRQITRRAPNLSVKAAQTATNADAAQTAANADALAGKTPNDIVMWGFVQSNGTLVRGSSGVGSSQIGTGAYAVNFPRDIDSCAYTATNSAGDNVVPATGQIAVAKASGGTNTVRVATANSAGTGANDQFMIQVTC
jgi:hypothetical protein